MVCAGWAEFRFGVALDESLEESGVAKDSVRSQQASFSEGFNSWDSGREQHFHSKGADKVN